MCVDAPGFNSHGQARPVGVVEVRETGVDANENREHVVRVGSSCDVIGAKARYEQQACSKGNS